VVGYFHSFSRSPVCDDYFGSSQAFPLLQQIVAGPEAIYEGDNLWFTQIAMGHDPGGVARGAVVGHHGGFWAAAARFDVVLDECLLFRCELTVR